MPDTGWREIIESGWNQLVPANMAKEVLPQTLGNKSAAYPDNLYGKGEASKLIVKAITSSLKN